MTSSYDFSTLSWEEVFFKLHEVEDLCAKCILKQKTLLAHFNSLSDSSSAKSCVYLAFGPLHQLDDSLFEQKCLLYLRLDFLSFTANSKNDITILSANDHPSYDDSVNNDPSPLPLTVWTSNHEANPNVILDLCIPSLQRTNHFSVAIFGALLNFF
ncbi:13955_t:CDS:1, partial [Rhizophagus irregularis]